MGYIAFLDALNENIRINCAVSENRQQIYSKNDNYIHTLVTNNKF